MILSGKSSGYSIRSGMHLRLWRPSHLSLELLEKRVHAAEHRSGSTIAHGLVVQTRDRQHFARGGGQPELLSRAQLGLRYLAYLAAHAVLLRELENDVAGDS